jgi:hypothetical protein
MSSRGLLRCGIVGPLLFVATIGIGGALHPGYNQLLSSISDLSSIDAPNRNPINAGFIVTYALLCLFAVGVFQVARTDRRGRLNGLACAAALAVSGLSGLIMQLFLPQDVGGLKLPLTPLELSHVLIANVAALSALFATLCAGLWLGERTGWRGFSLYSMATFGLMAVTGGGVLLAAFLQFP